MKQISESEFDVLLLLGFGFGSLFFVLCFISKIRKINSDIFPCFFWRLFTWIFKLEVELIYKCEYITPTP